MSEAKAISRGRQEAQRWLEQAEEDLRWTQHLVEVGGYYLACFLAQQVGKKALKALLYYQGEELVMGHSVEQLCQKASAYLAEIKEHCEDWEYLDNFYVPTRYPNALPGSIPAKVYNKKAASDTAATAREIVTFVRRILRGA